MNDVIKELIEIAAVKRMRSRRFSELAKPLLKDLVVINDSNVERIIKSVAPRRRIPVSGFFTQRNYIRRGWYCKEGMAMLFGCLRTISEVQNNNEVGIKFLTDFLTDPRHQVNNEDVIQRLMATTTTEEMSRILNEIEHFTESRLTSLLNLKKLGWMTY